MDGINIWNAIQYNEEPYENYNEREILLDIDKSMYCPFDFCGAIRKGKYKYIRGQQVWCFIRECWWLVASRPLAQATLV